MARPNARVRMAKSRAAVARGIAAATAIVAKGPTVPRVTTMVSACP
jgi:hypothetical protein